MEVPQPNERVLKVLISRESTETKNLTLLVPPLSPDSSTGLHVHDADEFMYVVTGREEGRCGQERSEIQVDILFCAPAGARREVRNTGEETMKLFRVFRPLVMPQGFPENATELVKERHGSNHRT